MQKIHLQLVIVFVSGFIVIAVLAFAFALAREGKAKEFLATGGGLIIVIKALFALYTSISGADG